MKASPGTVSGRVLGPGGEPLAGARVAYAQAPGPVADVALLSAADGSFTLGAPQPGRYELAAHADGLGTTTAAVEVGAAGAVVTLRFYPA